MRGGNGCKTRIATPPASAPIGATTAGAGILRRSRCGRHQLRHLTLERIRRLPNVL